MLRLSVLYFFWFILNTLILWYSEYFKSIEPYLKKFPIIDAPLMKFFENSAKFYMITDMDIKVYDLTEYTIALVVPLFVFNFIDHFKKPKYDKKFSFEE